MGINSNWIRIVGVLLLCTGHAHQARATSISVGTRIPIDATTFVVPIDIADGLDVIGWQFDVTYDASDMQINANCDPFSGDAYCSPLTGAVTEGAFFASGAPFNVLIPGFIDLDPTTLAQTGLLFGVNGAFGGSSPFPAGNGTLAFVEFVLLGNGDSAITVNGSAISATTVPEPGTLALLTTGLLWPRAWRWFNRSRI